MYGAGSIEKQIVFLGWLNFLVVFQTKSDTNITVYIYFDEIIPNVMLKLLFKCFCEL